MKVLKDNYKKEINIESGIQKISPYPRKLICEKCQSELQYDEADLRMELMGCMFIDCPLCHYSNMLEDNEKNIVLTMNNVEFPTHFHHTSIQTGAVDCCDNSTVRHYIREAINYFRKNKEEYYWGGHITGNLFIQVRRYSGDEEYDVIISNDFYSTPIPFESEDY